MRLRSDLLRTTARYLVPGSIVSVLAAGAIVVPSGSAAASTAAAKAELARTVSTYHSSVISPWRRLNGHLADVAIVGSRIPQPATVLVLTYLAGHWRVVQRFAAPKGALLSPGHFSPASHRPPEWMQNFALGRAQPAFAFYSTGASGWLGFVIARTSQRFGIVPFAGRGTRTLSYPEFRSRADVTTSLNNCTPDCARGRWTTQHYRYDDATRSFVYAGRPSSTGPTKPYPAP
jgi:hypothetical protein